METNADQQPSDESSPPAAAGYPSWILFAYFGGRSDDPDDRKTVAHARTSTGHPFSVSLVLAAPPAVSGMRLQTSPGLPDGVTISSHTIAADGDSVLVEVDTRSDDLHGHDNTWDYFLYCAGDAAAQPSRPPSLCLLSPCYLTEQKGRKPKHTRYMHTNGMALLRRGRDQVLVAALNSRVKDRKVREAPVEIELCLLRSSGDWEWELMLLPVIHDEGKREEVSRWCTDGVIPVGDRYLLWVDYFRGIIFSDVWQDTPELRYVSLPVDPSSFRDNNRRGASYRCVCATDAGRTVRFVDVSRRCCCGCPGETDCPVSRYAFTITTWALRMDDMKTWDKVGDIDCDELWSLLGYRGVVPRITPTYPILSLNDPDVISFMVRKHMFHKGVDGENGTRLIELDTRRMELRSIRYYYDSICFCPNFITSAVSQYFDPSSCNRIVPTRKDSDMEAHASPSKLALPRPVVPPESMLATLREIPNLTRDEMLTAYVVLACDENQFKFRSLLGLPMAMRKDYCLLIGKLSCFDV